MKKHISVLALIARGTIYKLLGLLVMMAAAETAMFCRADVFSASGLEMAVTYSRAALAFGVFFIVVFVLLSSNGCEHRGKQGYTLCRLRVSEKSVLMWQSIYNTICYILLWSAQTLVMIMLCRIYARLGAPEQPSPQAEFLAFYRSTFLHSLLPLAETSRWIFLAVLAPCMGTLTAAFTLRQRYGQFCVSAVLLAAIVVVFFNRGIGGFSGDILIALLALCLAARGVVKGWEDMKNEA